MRTLSPARVSLALLALFTWSGAMVLLSHAGVGAALVAGVGFTVPLVSLWEWITHGVLYHRPLPGLREIHAIHVGGHHGALFPPRAYVRQGPTSFMRFRAPRLPWRMSETAFDSLLTSGSQVGLHFVIGLPTIVLPAALLGGGTAFLASTLVSLGFLSFLLAYVHGVIHNPQGRWVERQRWFQWLDRHHYIHHVDQSANVNFLLPLCDVLFGTRKAALSPQEAASVPTFEQAKPMALDVAGRRHVA